MEIDNKTILDPALLINRIKEMLPKNTPIAKPSLYSAVPGGKLYRGFIAYRMCLLHAVNHKNALSIASAIEILHTFSLVHDDLPCMDNSLFRRGKVSCHKYFNNATALLTGVQLLITSLKTIGTISPELQKYTLCQVENLISGQMLDLEHNNKSTIEHKLYELKTGSLFIISCISGAVLANNTQDIDYLYQIGARIGIIFQILDDIIDQDIQDMEKAFIHSQKLLNEIKTLVAKCSHTPNFLQNFATKIFVKIKNYGIK
ncbi:MAG: polyprenyl synthetase family protein [Candidatus Xenolissoclinum pacificiensis L6]|uniref:Polyprenyl synthetase family protein n=1 Tax=Candidatus Xenolissoclinum pacificiensis L6 TaxID=1401685 RepID=W2V290_9RICK|nr:MAG: polyprenyl synthetase family protein [Candidatus Xenolissoclinum pacificiensis L6]